MIVPSDIFSAKFPKSYVLETGRNMSFMVVLFSLLVFGLIFSVCADDLDLALGLILMKPE